MQDNPLCPELPVFDLSHWLDTPNHNDPDLIQLCNAVAECLRTTGALIVKDPRATSEDNDRFLNLMETYFAQPTETKMADVRPELAYQVGATPEGIEKPRCLHDKSILDQAAQLQGEDKPTIPTSADVKWRFFWRLGARPLETRFKELNAAPVVPVGFPEWDTIMNTWGNKMLAAVATVAEMLAIGFGLDYDAFTQRMRLGPHLLAPTGTDAAKHGALGTVYAGYHYDLNFLTIHGKSRYPGLYIWLREGKRLPVRIPDGCLLIQAGKQMEWLTGGHVKAGFHEVLCTEGTLKACEEAKKQGRPQWRVSSTVFSQIASDEVLKPLGRFATAEALEEYPETASGTYVENELTAINLKAS